MLAFIGGLFAGIFRSELPAMTAEALEMSLAALDQHRSRLHAAWRSSSGCLLPWGLLWVPPVGASSGCCLWLPPLAASATPLATLSLSAAASAALSRPKSDRNRLQEGKHRFCANRFFS